MERAPSRIPEATERDRETSVAGMVESIIGCKWSVHLLLLLGSEDRRPSALLRASPGLSAKVMYQRLEKLVRYGIVSRQSCGERPPFEVHYSLTPFGRRFLRVIEVVQQLQAEVDRAKC